MSAVSKLLTHTMPGPQRPRQAVRLGHVAGPQPGRQPVRRVVGDAQGLRLVVELGHGQDRPEDLLARDPPAVVDPVEDGRLDVEPAGLLAHALAAADDARALLRAEPDVAEDLVQLARVDDRAELGRRVERLAGRQLAAHRRDALDQLLAHGAMDDEPRPGVAGLAAVVEDPPADRRGRLLQVADVGQDELRALAAELQRDRLDVALADRPEERLADLGRAGERDLVDARVAGQRVADDPARAGHDVEHAVGQPGLGRQLGQPQGASAATARPA